MRRRRGDDGATTVETALVLPVALVLLAGVLLFALRATYTALADHAVAVGLRTATLRGTTTYVDDVTGLQSRYPNQARVASVTGGLLGGLLGPPSTVQLTVRSVRTSQTKQQGDEVSLTLTYDLPAVQAAARLVPFAGDSLATGLGTVTASASGRLE